VTARRARLPGSTVLVTGAGSGLGRRMALEAARRGARVVMWDVSAGGGIVRDEIRAAGGSAETQTVDVADKDAVRAAAAAAGPVNVPAARMLPVPAFDRMMDALGINRTMDHFTGRPAD
jgi:all-trans-retinol dehydrogenase (NAD+)